MNELQTYNHPDFGSLEVWKGPDGKAWFPATESAEMLKYANPRKAIIDHCDEEGVTFRDTPTAGGTQQKKYINRPNLSRLIARSHLPEAVKFESWIFDDVLESVYDHGTYSAKPLTPAELSLLQAQALVDIERKQKEQQAALDNVNTRLDNIGDIIALNPNDWRRESKDMIVRIAQALGGNSFIRDVTAEIYQIMLDRFGISVKARLTNKRRKALEEGMPKSRADKISGVDTIADDKKAIEAFLTVIKEMAIKYGLDKQPVEA